MNVDPGPLADPSSTTARRVVVMAGRLGELRELVASGAHPNVEILDLVARHDMALFSYEDLDGAGRFLGFVARRVGPHLALALLTTRRFRDGEVLVATGEDVGLPMALAHGLRRRGRGRARIAIIAHGSFLNSDRVGLVGKLLRRRRDVKFLALASSLSQMLVERAGLGSDQVATIGFGTDAEFFVPDGHERAERLHVASAGLASRDYRTLVDAMREIDGDLTIAADSAWFRSPLDIEADELPDDVEVRSFGDYVGLRTLYARSDVTVVPLREGRHACGYAVIAEAMAMGLPVIATSTMGRSDLIVDGVNGWYVAPGDVTGIRARLRSIAADPVSAAAVGARAREDLVRHNSVHAFADRIASTVDALFEPASAR